MPGVDLSLFLCFTIFLIHCVLANGVLVKGFWSNLSTQGCDSWLMPTLRQPCKKSCFANVPQTNHNGWLICQCSPCQMLFWSNLSTQRCDSWLIPYFKQLFQKSCLHLFTSSCSILALLKFSFQSLHLQNPEVKMSHIWPLKSNLSFIAWSILTVIQWLQVHLLCMI